MRDQSLSRSLEKTNLSLFFLAGPLSLLFTLSLGLTQSGNLDLLLVAVIGLFLSVSFRIRGLVYATLFLIIGAVFKHLLFLDQHLWQLGIEASMVIGFALTAMTAEWSQNAEETLLLQMKNQRETLSHLEEELVKLKETALAEQITLQEKWALTQKELDDRESELSAITILNDVLRKTSASKVEDGEARMIELVGEIELLEKELASLKSEKTEVRDLLKELNAARVAREQTHLINQTLATMLASQVSASEVSVPASNQRPTLEEDKRALAKAQTLHRELRGQFEEKKIILHQTRRELFHTHTELEALRLAKENEWDKALLKNLIALSEECQNLESENSSLTALITELSKSGDPRA